MKLVVGVLHAANELSWRSWSCSHYILLLWCDPARTAVIASKHLEQQDLAQVRLCSQHASPTLSQSGASGVQRP